MAMAENQRRRQWHEINKRRMAMKKRRSETYVAAISIMKKAYQQYQQKHAAMALSRSSSWRNSSRTNETAKSGEIINGVSISIESVAASKTA